MFTSMYVLLQIKIQSIQLDHTRWRLSPSVIVTNGVDQFRLIGTLAENKYKCYLLKRY